MQYANVKPKEPVSNNGSEIAKSIFIFFHQKNITYIQHLKHKALFFIFFFNVIPTKTHCCNAVSFKMAILAKDILIPCHPERSGNIWEF